MKQALVYSLKVWLTTSLIAPVLITLQRFIIVHKNLVEGHYDQMFVHRQYVKLVSQLLYMIAGQFIMLLPLVVALYLTIGYLDRRQTLLRFYKWYLCIVGVVLAVLPYALILWYTMTVVQSSYKAIYLSNIAINGLLYAVVVMACIWLYNLRSVQTTPNSPSTM